MLSSRMQSLFRVYIYSLFPNTTNRLFLLFRYNSLLAKNTNLRKKYNIHKKIFSYHSFQIYGQFSLPIFITHDKHLLCMVLPMTPESHK